MTTNEHRRERIAITDARIAKRLAVLRMLTAPWAKYPRAGEFR